MLTVGNGDLRSPTSGPVSVQVCQDTSDLLFVAFNVALLGSICRDTKVTR